MKYTCHNMNAYNLHIINTDKFKTVTISVELTKYPQQKEHSIFK